MKHYKPTTKSRRNMSGINYRQFVTTNEPEKSLTKGFSRGNGRNNTGRVTTRHKGGGHKRLFRAIDFLFDKRDVPFVVKTVEYDPNRSGFIGLAQYKDGEKRYVLLHNTAQVGDENVVSDKAPMIPGNRMPLGNMLVGTFVYNIELKQGGGAKLARSGGDYAEILAKDGGYVDIKLPSTEVRKVPVNAWATIGEVSNNENRLVKIGKAGRNRWLGIRPTVRGTAMNPVDHPHGGGEGRQGRGRRRAISIYGKPTGKGQKSRRSKKYSNKFIVNRRRVGKK
ncbi:MAG: 50S ribosomal protein L2 [Candidatus Zambryskibacteria bacterium RIFCSPLOWO2_02_FULL_51_21]|uniref:Large ribosomal subunit protein uL2 n=1 Tax=Candidatus Zambryskibacteria bacterium RIFCSPHIGHO2_02_FULL_43_37 TaxID=1802749 RepID=A0A1G2TGJ0_9BACT|nr:MAG: 50S ribosomal protein L2 [Candidatus Zambryskibacteria bacterium RIFCSPHIGHO2_01_FULL_52_18]OHA96407.1 MAG: 50S ribosomal protein L2 [Candidatus Zambryskibacteria bacterium RIFCSPHIGHO2_02_FULL_43_37]OHB11333.1 MAG: 50S ribosomal protein L2 [Candidatus Zambryskibacteria bacterium RIFCSPLOWO2_02_FULL_51_21]